MASKYFWEAALEDAVLEVDDRRLIWRIEHAKLLVNMRIQEMLMNGGLVGVEREALENALRSLNKLRAERVPSYLPARHESNPF